MQSKSEPTCPICDQPLASGPTTTLVDNEPYLLRREPPVSVRVHRACVDMIVQFFAATNTAQPVEA